MSAVARKGRLTDRVPWFTFAPRPSHDSADISGPTGGGGGRLRRQVQTPTRRPCSLAALRVLVRRTTPTLGVPSGAAGARALLAAVELEGFQPMGGEGYA